MILVHSTRSSSVWPCVRCFPPFPPFRHGRVMPSCFCKAESQRSTSPCPLYHIKCMPILFIWWSTKGCIFFLLLPPLILLAFGMTTCVAPTFCPVTTRLKAATDGNQAGLIDLYYNKDTSGWKISSNGHEQLASDPFQAGQNPRLQRKTMFEGPKLFHFHGCFREGSLL